MTSEDQAQPGRVALVTGSSRNIGRAIACALAKDRMNVAVHGVTNKEAADETARMVEEHGVKAMVTMGDLSDPQSAPRIINDVINEFGRLDVLVNNAAVRPESPIADMDYAEWKNVLGICLDAAFLLTQSALEYLETSEQGAIINIGGLTAHTSAANRVHVITAKAGIVGFTKALAHELSPNGITVNCVSPGLIETIKAEGETVPHHHSTRTNILGRRGKPEEVAETVAFLAGPLARYITGQTIHVNGGAFLG
jgi:3-oxoacyl-[acyl-carrier protein] reductase